MLVLLIKFFVINLPIMLMCILNIVCNYTYKCSWWFKIIYI